MVISQYLKTFLIVRSVGALLRSEILLNILQEQQQKKNLASTGQPPITKKHPVQNVNNAKDEKFWVCINLRRQIEL